MPSDATTPAAVFSPANARPRDQSVARGFLPGLLRQTQLATLQDVAGRRLLTVLGLMVCGYVVVNMIGDQQLFILANYIGPSILAVTSGCAGWDLLRKAPSAIWTPYFWAVANCCAFFGIGSLVPLLGNRATRETLAFGPFGVDAGWLFRTNFLNATGLFCMFLGLAVVSVTGWAQRDTRLRAAHPLSTSVLAMWFVIGGAFVRFGVLLPYRFRMSDFMIPGVSHLGHLIDIGFALCAFLGASGRRGWYGVLALLWPLHIATIVLEFSKFPLIIAIVLPALGMFLATGRRRVLVNAGILSCVVFATVQPLFIATRQQVAFAEGTIHQATLNERWQIISRTIQAPQWLPNRISDRQHALMRLYYNGPERFAMGRYDAGQAYKSPMAYWKLVLPRILVNNDDAVSPGKELYYLASGRRTCTVGLPIWADGYWQWGWPGAIGLSLLAGAFFGILSKRALVAISSRQFIMLPIILVGMKAGMVGPTNFFVSAVLSIIPIYVGYTIVAVVLTGMTSVENASDSGRESTV